MLPLTWSSRDQCADAFTRYYVMSTILGTVALSYGSVPLYKMVSSRVKLACGSRLTHARSAKPPAGAANLYAPTAEATAMTSPADSSL